MGGTLLVISDIVELRRIRGVVDRAAAVEGGAHVAQVVRQLVAMPAMLQRPVGAEVGRGGGG